MPIQPTPGCLWYWDGSVWSGPNAVGGCTSCASSGSTLPANGPTPNEPCFVLVDCPDFGKNPDGAAAPPKRFYIHVPDDWQLKAIQYPHGHP